MVLRVVLISTSISPSSVTIACRIRRIVRRRSSSASLNEPMLVSSESSASASSRNTVNGVRKPVRQVRDQLELVGAGDAEPLGHPVEGEPRLGQLARAARLDPGVEVAVAEPDRRLGQAAGGADRAAGDPVDRRSR